VALKPEDLRKIAVALEGGMHDAQRAGHNTGKMKDALALVQAELGEDAAPSERPGQKPTRGKKEAEKAGE